MILNVASPILGFEHIKSFELVKIDQFFVKLQSQDDNTSFTAIDPYTLRNYDFEVPTYYEELMQLKKDSDLRVYNIIVVAIPLENSTVNFIAPVVINLDNKTLSQVVLDATKYPDYGQAEPISKFISKQNEK